MSEAQSAAPTLEVTVNTSGQLGVFRRSTGRTGEKDGHDGDQIQGHGDGAKRGVGASSFVNHFLLLLRVPALELVVSLVIARSGLHAVVA